jgi:hypothetical protein
MGQGWGPPFTRLSGVKFPKPGRAEEEGGGYPFGRSGRLAFELQGVGKGQEAREEEGVVP